MHKNVHLLDELNLSFRSMKALYFYGVVTIEDVLFMSQDEIKKIPSLGKSSFVEIENALKRWEMESHNEGISFSDRVEFEIIHTGLSHTISFILYQGHIRVFYDLLYVMSPGFGIQKRIRKDWIRETVTKRYLELKDILRCHPENYFGFMAFVERIEKLLSPYILQFSDKKRLYRFFGQVFQKYCSVCLDDVAFFCSKEVSNIFYADERLSAIMREFLLSIAGRPGKFDKKQIEKKYKLFPILPALFTDVVNVHNTLRAQLSSSISDGCTLDTWLLSIAPREAAMLKMRLEGKSLRAVGKVFGISGERVRQASDKELCDKPILKEDSYVNFFEKYQFREDSFCKITGENPRVFWYLCMLHNRGKLKLFNILNDETVSKEMKERAMSYFRKKFGLADRLRDAVCKFAIEPIHVDDFYDKYCNYLKQEGIEEKALNKKNLVARLGHIPCVLFNGEFVFRYYPIETVDGKELERRLELFSFSDIAISSKFIFDKFPDYMKELDVRTANELHNLLRKKSNVFSSKIKFGRMPTLIFGKGSYEQQVKELMKEMGVVSRRDFIKAYCEKYGVNESLFSGRLAEYMRQYRGRNCTFLLPEGCLSKKNLQVAKRIFRKPVYTEKEVCSIIKDNFGEQFIKINDKDWWDIGYKHKKNIYYKKQFSSVENALDFLFKEPIKRFDLRGVKNVGIIYYFVSRGKTDSVHRAGPDMFVNHVWLAQNGFTKELILDFANAVSSFVGDTTFTLLSLRNEGFYHPIFEKTTNDWLLSSFIRAHCDIYSRATKECIFFSRNEEYPGVFSVMREIKASRDWKNAKEMHKYILEHFGYCGNLATFTFAYKDMMK